MQTGPTTFARIIFRQHGLDLLTDCTYLPQSEPGLDERVKGMLHGGEIEAAVISAAPFAPEREGFRILAFFGNLVPATATGLAVNTRLVSPDDPQVQAVTRAHQAALRRLHADRDLAIRAILDVEPQTSPEDAAQLYDRYIHPYWSPDGRVDLAKAQQSLQAIAREIGATQLPHLVELYRTPT
jgi:hypothetical protein